MTKYILHGGYTSSLSIHNTNFFKEMVKGLSEPVKVLTVYFAASKEKWQELFEDDKKKFSSFNLDIEMEFILASDNMDILISQIKSADTIYIRGGRELLVYEIFKRIKNLAELFEGKVVSGSSAGAYVLSKYFYSNIRNSIQEGTGLLPIKAFCHYAEEKAAKLKRLKAHGEDLEVYTIP
ncbi:MAG: Type 1 glutamine amidotransferase-like domain-containing protein, partial [Parcubacteria group bacterium]|nr:Type 1 glutamine amidotransferase-like domain-containing protein [Parcubacteria group bacterium]